MTTDTSTTPTADQPCPPGCTAGPGNHVDITPDDPRCDDAPARIADPLEKILAGDDEETMAVVTLAAALKARGIDFHLRVDHGPNGEPTPHRHALILDDTACRELADRIEASDFVTAMRKAGAALQKATTAFREGLEQMPPVDLGHFVASRPAPTPDAATGDTSEAQR